MVQLDVVSNLLDVLKERDENVVLVVSAFEDVTNALYAAMDQLNGKDFSEADIDAAFTQVREKHEVVIKKFRPHLDKAQATYDAGFDILKRSLITHKKTSNILMAVAGSFQIRDQVIGFGEEMAAAFLHIYLEQVGKESQLIENVIADQETLRQGPVTDIVLAESKKKGITSILRNIDETRRGVTQIWGGHMKGTPKGLVVHQSRGYSDIMAVDVTDAYEEIGVPVQDTRYWKDVDGVYTGNPKDLDSSQNTPVLHRDISNVEAQENASAGSGIIHINALSQAARNRRTLKIRNIKRLDPEYGTDIVTGSVDTAHVFKTIVNHPRVDAITVTLPLMADRNGFGASIMRTFAEHDVSIDQICTEGTSITFSVPLPRDKADQERIRTNIRKIIEKLKIIEVDEERFTMEDIQWHKGLASVSVIGSEIKNHPGIRGSLLTTLEAFGIPVHGVSHSEQQVRISYLIDTSHGKKAGELFHSIYVDNNAEVIAERARRVAEMEGDLTGTYNGK